MRAVLCFAFCSALTSCYPVKQYQSNLVGQFPLRKDQPAGLQIPLAFIEFDDNGEIFSREQLDNTVQKITSLRESCPSGLTTILFIHGWKNNADTNSNNVAGFEQFLREVHPAAPQPSAVGQNCPTPLLGVYIGWRGARVRFGKTLSYWNGADAAVRAGGPDLQETLRRIMGAARPPGDLKSILIFIGHSFGGRVLEKVMTPYLETLILQEDRHATGTGCVSSRGEQRPITGALPTLTVLLNEAAPATDAKQFLDILKCHDVQTSSGEEQYPLFLSITSDGDWANHVVLPIGQSAARLKMKTRAYCTGDPEKDRQSKCSGDPADPSVITNQSTYYTHSTASIPALYSHYVMKGDSCSSKDTPTGPPWVSGKDTYVFCRIAGAWNQTPYWISSLPVAIVPDHSNIFHPELYAMLRSFIRERVASRAPKTQAR